MRRDLDLARQLLFEIEQQGPDCSLASLRGTLVPREQVVSDRGVDPRTYEVRPVGADEAILYQLRLMIDANLAKETERTGASPCIRLTHAGHELLELSRSEARWQEAKLQTLESSGGESLTVIRAILTKWAVESAARPRRVYERPVVARPYGYASEYVTAVPRRTYGAPRTVAQHVVDYHRPYRYGPYNYRETYTHRDQAQYTDSYAGFTPEYQRYARPVVREEAPRQREPSLNVLRSRPDYREPLPVRARYDIRQQLDWRDAYDRDFYYNRSQYGRYEPTRYAAAPYATAPQPGRPTEVYPAEVDSAGIGVSLPIYMV